MLKTPVFSRVPSLGEDKDLLIMPLTLTRRIRNIMHALRAVATVLHHDVELPLVVLGQSQTRACLAAYIPAMSEVKVDPFSSPEAVEVTHAIALGLNVVLLPQQRPPPFELHRALVPPGLAPERVPFVVSNASNLLPSIFPVYSTSFNEFDGLRFRVEFLRDYCQPLCPTAMLASCPIGSQNEHKLAAMRATLSLLNDVVPTRAAAILDREPFPLYGDDLSQRLHSLGVNLRFLGWLMPWMRNDEPRRAVCTEIVARAFKRCNEEEVEWATLSKAAMKRFFPCHLHCPLPPFHRSSEVMLRRLHPRYGIDVDTLDMSRLEDIPNVDLSISVDAKSLPPTPEYQQFYDYENLSTDHVDNDKLEERISQLCHFEHKVMALPGSWWQYTRQHFVSHAPSGAVTAYYQSLQTKLLARLDFFGNSHEVRLLPILSGLAAAASVLYPHESSLTDDNSPFPYMSHAVKIAEDLRTSEKDLLPALPEQAQHDLSCSVMLDMAKLQAMSGSPSDGIECCNRALQIVVNPSIEARFNDDSLRSHAQFQNGGNQGAVCRVDAAASSTRTKTLIVVSSGATREALQMYQQVTAHAGSLSAATHSHKSFLSHGLSVQVLRLIRDNNNSAKLQASKYYVSPPCRRLSLSSEPVVEGDTDLITVVAKFLQADNRSHLLLFERNPLAHIHAPANSLLP